MTAEVTLESEVPKPDSVFSHHKNIMSGVAWFYSFKFYLTVDSFIRGTNAHWRVSLCEGLSRARAAQ